MPELPEVETLRRDLALLLPGRTITGVRVFWGKTITPFTPRQFATRLKNKTIENVERRAKMLIIRLNDEHFLVVHLKMTGQLIYSPKGSTLKLAKVEPLIVGGHPQAGGTENLPNKFTRVALEFENGAHLYFNDLRKFGWMRLMTPKELITVTTKLGPEPLESLTPTVWQKILKK